MVSLQTVIKVKDNSKILKVKIIHSYLKKNIQCKNTFLGVVLDSRNSLIKKGTIRTFILSSTKVKVKGLTGRYKSSNKNQSLKVKSHKIIIPTSTRFIGSFFSDLYYGTTIKLKNIIEKCI